MPLVAVVLVLISACTHIYWNAQVKKAPNGEIFSFNMQVLGAAMSLATGLFQVFYIERQTALNLPWQGVLCAVGTGIVYGAYYTTIAMSYKRGDLSLTYPIARGFAPIATLALGMAFYAERPGLFGLLGIGLVIFGVVYSALEAKGGAVRLTLSSVFLALATGSCTALYSAIDKQGAHLINPMVYLGMSFGVGSAVQYFQLHLRKADFSMKGADPVAFIGASLANTYGYVLVLYAMQIAPISYVVPTRSVAVLFSIVVGAAFFKEKVTLRRVVSAAAILAGIVCISSLDASAKVPPKPKVAQQQTSTRPSVSGSFDGRHGLNGLGQRLAGGFGYYSTVTFGVDAGKVTRSGEIGPF